MKKKEQMNIKIQRTDYFYVVLMLLTSCTPFYFQYLTPGISYSIFFIFSFFLFIKRRVKIIVNHSYIYSLIFSLSILCNKFLFNPDTMNNKWMGYLIGCIGAYFFFSSIKLDVFRKAYLRVITVITFISIIAFLLDISHIGDPFIEYRMINDTSFRMIFEIFVTGWLAPNYRMSSIWHEPGACQIFLNTAFILYMPYITNHLLSKYDKICLIIIVLGLLCTQSTTGYMIFAIIAFFLVKSFFSKLPKILSHFILPIVIGIGILSSSIIEDKFSQDIDEDTSLGVRQRDNYACLYMSIDRPLTGYGFGSKDYINMSFQQDNLTSSNGILATSASLGIWWLLLYLFFLYKGCKKQKTGMPIWITVLLVVLMQSNENYIEYPISYVFLLSFYEKKQSLKIRE